MATRKSYYVSDDLAEYIPVTTVNKMERDAAKHGWKFTFNHNRTEVTIDWGEGNTIDHYNLVTEEQ